MFLFKDKSEKGARSAHWKLQNIIEIILKYLINEDICHINGLGNSSIINVSVLHKLFYRFDIVLIEVLEAFL